MKTSNKYLLVAAVATVLSATDSWGMQQFVRTERGLPTATNPAPTKITLTLQNGEECSFEKGNSEETLAALDKVVTARELPYIASLARHAVNSGASYKNVSEKISPISSLELQDWGYNSFIEEIPIQERLLFCLNRGDVNGAGLTLSRLTYVEFEPTTEGSTELAAARLASARMDSVLQKQIKLLQQTEPDTEAGKELKDNLLKEIGLKMALGEKY